jgi:hypothetical protein
MRLAVCLVAVALVSSSPPIEAKRVMRPRTIAELCRGPLTWTALAKCVTEHGVKQLDKPETTMTTINDDHGSYLFARDPDGKWWFAHTYPKLGYTVLSRSDDNIHGKRVDRIEARYRLELGGRLGRSDTVLQKIAILCRAHSCTDMVYECTRMQDGRATETFIGTIEPEGDWFHVVGDHSQAGSMCR